MGYVSHEDLIEQAIHAAMGEPCRITGMPQYEGYWYEYILHAEKSGTFEDVLIDDKLHDNLIERDIWVKPGDSVHTFTGANETIGTLIFKFSDEEQMQDAVRNSMNWIRVKTR